MARHAMALETVTVIVPPDALEAYEAALLTACSTVAFFLDEAKGLWHVEGVKDQGDHEPELAAGLALAAAATGFSATLIRHATAAEGWLARTFEAFPEQLVGRRFAVRGTHLTEPGAPGRLALLLDAGLAFGSGEHGSTRGCLRALERIAHRRPRRILDVGTGSGILAMAAGKLLHCEVLATDIDPWSVRVAASNARLNHLRGMRVIRADGWLSPQLRRSAPFSLIFANILARPLCRMARAMAAGLAAGGTLILAGLLGTQIRWVLAAYRRQGIFLDFALTEGPWATLVLRKPFTR